MRMKSYFAAGVDVAMEQARSELGPDALLVSSRKSPPEAHGLGEYEVVFAVLPESMQMPDSGRGPHANGTPQISGAALEDPVLRELSSLRKQMQDMSSAFLVPGPPGRETPGSTREFEAISSALIENGFSIEVSAKLMSQVRARMEAGPEARTRNKQQFETDEIECLLRAELERAVSADATLGKPGAQADVAALVGPPGSGKTSTLVKLAVHYGVARSRPVHLISTGTHRVGAVEQLRTYAAVMGAAFDAAETPQVLEQLLATQSGKALVLIDTGGCAAVDMAEASDWARFFCCHKGIDVHLVVPASMRTGDLSRTIDRFEAFGPAKLIFTRLDEVSAFGMIAGESVRTRKPISFLTSGQEIPEDLEAASLKGVLELALETLNRQARSAA